MTTTEIVLIVALLAAIIFIIREKRKKTTPGMPPIQLPDGVSYKWPPTRKQADFIYCYALYLGNTSDGLKDFVSVVKNSYPDWTIPDCTNFDPEKPPT